MESCSAFEVGSAGANTPGGYDPWTQVNVYVSIPVHRPVDHATANIVLGKGIPVLVQEAGGTPHPTSACNIRVGDKVTVWAPLQSFYDQPNDSALPSEDDSFEAQELIINRGS